jgi:murein L,D-transpeptidase YcbB/YkuD
MEQDRMNRPGETVNPAAPVEPVALKESAVLPPPAETPAGAQPADQPQPKPTDEPAPVSSSAPQPAPAPKPASEPRLTTLNIPPAATPESEALHKALAGLPAGATDEERNEHEALSAFYESRGYAPIWLAPHAGLTPKGTSILAEIKRANEWGLEAHDFALPKAEAVADASPEALADAEIKMSLAILKYGRYARGGRIIDPSEQLSSYLDRRPQLLKPKSIIDGIAEAEKPDAFLRSLHPVHPQFERLRQKYLALLEHGKEHSAEAKKLLANMEEWRWMPIDMGEVYVWNNIPEFTQRVVKSGKIVREARIVAGETDKQTPIFTRPLRKITFKPTWIVPDSIKVKELWPSLLKGGGLLREWKLEVRTKEGQLVNWHKIDWSAADIREYDVLQPNGPKSVMGKVKFSFPSQHTVFMHDTLERDKWMFHASKRTYSHGCMRVANPIGLAEILLHEDKGMDAAQVRQAVATGPNNNEFPIEHKIFVHMTYFTALVDDDGKLHTFSDVYGHERRITLALEGKWNQIVKGRNHLAPVELDLSEARPRHYAEDDAGDLPAWRQRDSNSFRNGFFNSLFGSAR